MQNLAFHSDLATKQIIQEQGFSPDLFSRFLGASGGPKWLTLLELDKLMFADFLQQRPIDAIGSSSGAWRVACLAQSDPVLALTRFSDNYIAQTYSAKPTIKEIGDSAVVMLNAVLGKEGGEQILQHPTVNAHIIANRSSLNLPNNSKYRLMLWLLATAGANAISRDLLGYFFKRVIFSAKKSADLSSFTDFPTEYAQLSKDNLFKALLASGSIPVVLPAIKDIPGVQKGTFYDGGLTDYHLTLPEPKEGLAIFPHFYQHALPGWFDKHKNTSKIGFKCSKRTLAITPSQAYVDNLPYGRIPDRHDFAKLTNDERQKIWRIVTDRSHYLAEEFFELWQSNKIAERIIAY